MWTCDRKQKVGVCGWWNLLMQVLVSYILSDPVRPSYGWQTVVIKDGRLATRGKKKLGQNSYERFWYVFYR